MARILADNPIIDAYRTICGGNVWRWSRYWRDTFNLAVRPSMGLGEANRYETRLPDVRHAHTAIVATGDLRIKWVLFPSESKPGARKVRHRVFLECPCGQLVPAGRVHQHRC